MKLPQAQINGVQRLAQESVGQAAQTELTKGEVAATKINAVGKPLIAGGKLYDNFIATEAAKESEIERTNVANAFDEATGKIDVAMLSDDVYRAHMTNSNLSAQNDVIDGDRRLTDLHNVTDSLAEEFKVSEKKRADRMAGNSQRTIYETEEKGAGEDYLRSLMLKGRNSLITATRDMKVDTIINAAGAGDTTAVLDVLDSLKSVANDKQVEAIKQAAFKELKVVKTEQLNNEAELAYQDSFGGNDAQVKAAAEARKLDLDQLVADGVYTAEEREKLDYEFQNRVRLESDKGDVKWLYDTQGREAAIDYVQKAFRSKGSDSDQGDEYERAKKLNTYFNEIDIYEKAKSAASNANIVNRAKDYYVIVGKNNKDASDGDVLGDEDVRASILTDAKANLTPEKYKEVELILDRADLGKRLKRLPTEDFNEAYNTLSQNYTDLDSSEDLAFINEIAVSRSKSIKNDPLNFYSVSQGLPAEATYFDFNQPVKSIARIAETARMAEAHLGVPVSRLPKPMLEDLAARIKSGEVTYDEQLSVLEAVGSLPTDEQLPTIMELSNTGNGILSSAAMMMRDGKNIKGVLQGSEALRFNPDILKKKDGAGSLQDKLISTGFMDAFSGSEPKFQASLRDAVKAQYIYNTGMKPTTGWDMPELREAIATVTNGLLEAGGVKTQAVYEGQTQSEFDYAKRQVGDLEIQALGGTKMNIDKLKGLIVSGGRYVPTGDGAGRYYIQYTSKITNKPVLAPNASGGNFVLDFNELGGDFNNPSFVPPVTPVTPDQQKLRDKYATGQTAADK